MQIYRHVYADAERFAQDVHVNYGGKDALIICELNVPNGVSDPLIHWGQKMLTYQVHARWDDEAKVWWADSEDVPGLAAESASHDELIQDIKLLVVELLELNVPAARGKRVSVKIVSEQIEDLCDA